MDDRRVGLVIRALRRRRGMRQSDLARAASVSQSVISRAERGHLTTLSTSIVRSILTALDARAEWDIRWRGGELDRLIDEAHARLGSLVASEETALGWQVVPEVTFMRLGERGSIDLAAVNIELRAAAIHELKSELTSYEQTQRRFDVKMRVAASVIEERFGWRPQHLGMFLVLSDTRTNRDRVSRVAPLIRASLPAHNSEIRQWLRSPSGNISGIWFVREMRPGTGVRKSGGSHRVRVRR
ncbi:MAG TPA: helix-turn-helix transcriptional regulator [Candidatus Limnocylindrales bacterium]|nr:helix-turn-helix transcriptional regulator [Candidatus Limnocylindrales bacterium]